MSTCIETECNEPAKIRGRCQRHYDKARYVGAIAVRPCAKRGALIAFLKQNVDTTTDDCILWPFGLDGSGYGQIVLDGVSMTASRAMCLLAHGEPAFDGAEAAHSCTSHDCINPNHLRWATSTDNHADKRIHGTLAEGESHGRAKLTRDAAARILADHEPATIAAKTAMCSVSNVRAIRSRRTWRCLDALAV